MILNVIVAFDTPQYVAPPRPYFGSQVASYENDASHTKIFLLECNNFAMLDEAMFRDHKVHTEEKDLDGL